MSKLIVKKVIQKFDPKSGISKSGPNQGKEYHVYEFEIDGTLDGAPIASTKLSTLNKDQAETVKDGVEFEVDPAKFGGGYSIKYAPKPAGEKKPWAGGGGFNREPATKYTREELKTLYKWCVITSAEVLGVAADPQSGWDPLQLQALNAGAATLLIAAQKSGLK